MSKRKYNVFFNTHTISGIVISVALYIIFFAGAFALFKEEIAIWETGKKVSHTKRTAIDYDNIFKKLNSKYDLLGRDIQLNFGGESDKVYTYLAASKDSLASEKAKEAHYFSVAINAAETQSYEEHYNLGEFLYRLHFFHQIPIIGVYIAGFIAFFFLFAIVTGVIVHWKKIIPNFYTFNPKIALKRVWSDAHTALGIIGLPFQFMFAITGTYFCLSILVLIPANFLYGGDQSKLLEDLRPARKTYKWQEKYEKELPSFNTYVNKTNEHWEDFQVTRAFVRNYGGTNMKFVIMGELQDEKRFVGTGRIVYNAITGEIESEKNPNELTYIEDVQSVVGRLHFGNFGGRSIKLVYFILSLITCFVIITGVLIWVEARNKKSMTIHQRLYTAKVGHIYLAICLSMLPVTAISFLFVKFFGGNFLNKQTAIYYCYFITWGITMLIFRFKRDNYWVNKNSLLVSAIAGILIPISSGIISDNWIWKTIANQQYEILTIDVLWILISMVSFYAYSKVSKKIKGQSSFNKNPITYENLDSKKEIKIKENTHNNKNYIPMRIRIISLWTLIIIGFLIHHIYGIANVYFKTSLVIEGSTGEIPGWAHQWRILLEGMAFLFAVLTIQVTRKWFKWTSLIWASLLGLFNIYHFITAIIYEASNISEIFILLIMVVVNGFLLKELIDWKTEEN